MNSSFPSNSHERAFYRGFQWAFYHQDTKDGIHKVKIPSEWYDEESDSSKPFDIFKLMGCFEDDFNDDGGQIWYFGLEEGPTLVGACTEADKGLTWTLEGYEGEGFIIIQDIWEIARRVRDDNKK